MGPISRREHHAHCLGNVALIVGEHLGDLVEAHRVGSVGGINRIALTRQRSAAGVDVCAIAPDGVDLAVVSHHAQRLSAVPRRQHVSRVALVKDREMRSVQLVLQVGIELVQRATGAQRLVHQRASRERADVGVGSATLEGLAGEEQATLQLVGVAVEGLRRSHQSLSNDRQGSQGQLAQDLARNRNVAPGEPLEAARRNTCLKTLRVTLSGFFVLRQKQHSNRERLLGTKRDSGLTQQKMAWNCSLHANAVAAFAVGSNRSAVSEAPERS